MTLLQIPLDQPLASKLSRAHHDQLFDMTTPPTIGHSFLFLLTMQTALRRLQPISRSFRFNYRSMSTEALRADKLFDLSGWVTLVTGGGTGIGLMCAQALAANKAKVYIASVSC